MTGTVLSSADLDPRRSRLLYRAWHRGTREMDLVLGRFTDVSLSGFSDLELDVFEQVLDFKDDDLFAWIVQKHPVPENLASPLLMRICNFYESFPAL